MNIIKNIENSLIIVQWDAVDATIYTVTWTDEKDVDGVDTVDEQTSYTITGLTLDTVYTITVTAANMCGDGPEFITSILFFAVTTFTTAPTISPSVGTTITYTVNPVSIIVSATTTTITTTMTITASAITTTNSMTAAVSRDTGNTIKATTTLTVPSSNVGATTTTVIKCFGMCCYYWNNNLCIIKYCS